MSCRVGWSPSRGCVSSSSSMVRLRGLCAVAACRVIGRPEVDEARGSIDTVGLSACAGGQGAAATTLQEPGALAVLMESREAASGGSREGRCSPGWLWRLQRQLHVLVCCNSLRVNFWQAGSRKADVPLLAGLHNGSANGLIVNPVWYSLDHVW